MSATNEPGGRTETNREATVRHGQPEPQPMLFLVLEANRPLAAPARWRLDGLRELVIGRGPRRTKASSGAEGGSVLTITVPDDYLSTTHARIRVLDDECIIEDAPSKNGTIVNGTRVESAPLRDGDIIEVGRTFFLFRSSRTVGETDPRAAEVSELPHVAPELATMVPELLRAFANLRAAISAGVPVLVSGETGTGKEVVGRAVHALSGRSGEFVGVNCGAIPPNLVESALFGHRKGAFSGAVDDQPGHIRAADRGILFLDEIGEMPLPAQVAFLRVLENRAVVPIGSSKPIPVDVMLVSATNRPLLELVEEGQFRSDLFARIDGHRVGLPALRERREDLGLLIAALLRSIAPAKADRVVFTPQAARSLVRYDYPRNIRQLRTILASALAVAGEGPVDVMHLPDELRETDAATVNEPLDDELAQTLIALLTKHGGNVTAVGRELGKDRKQIFRWLKRGNIDPKRFRR